MINNQILVTIKNFFFLFISFVTLPKLHNRKLSPQCHLLGIPPLGSHEIGIAPKIDKIARESNPAYQVVTLSLRATCFVRVTPISPFLTTMSPLCHL